LKELNETLIWLRMIERSKILKVELLGGIIEENRELCQLFTSSAIWYEIKLLFLG